MSDYPSEWTWWPAYRDKVRALYAQAGRAADYPDEAMATAFTWTQRPAYDIGAGMDPEAAARKHLGDLARELGLTPPMPALRPLAIDGQFFTAGGQPWTAIQCSDFNLFNRFLRGEDILPVLRQRREVGFNLLRIWTAFDLEDAGIGRLRPFDHWGYGASLISFLRLCAEHGLYVELTAFAGRVDVGYRTIFRDDTAIETHWRVVIEAVTAEWDRCLLERVNEADHTANRDLPWGRLTRPDGLLASAGSMTADVWPPDVWTYAQYHSNDLHEWQRKVGHNAWEIAEAFNVPVISNENTRFPDHDDNVTHAQDAAAGAALLCAGAAFHSVHGKSSQLWEGRELVCAHAWAVGAQSVPLEFQRGVYARHDDLLRPGLLRVYSRTLADGRRHVVEVRA